MLYTHLSFNVCERVRAFVEERQRERDHLGVLQREGEKMGDLGVVVGVIVFECIQESV